MTVTEECSTQKIKAETKVKKPRAAKSAGLAKEKLFNRYFARLKKLSPNPQLVTVANKRVLVDPISGIHCTEYVRLPVCKTKIKTMADTLEWDLVGGFANSASALQFCQQQFDAMMGTPATQQDPEIGHFRDNLLNLIKVKYNTFALEAHSCGLKISVPSQEEEQQKAAKRKRESPEGSPESLSKAIAFVVDGSGAVHRDRSVFLDKYKNCVVNAQDLISLQSSTTEQDPLHEDYHIMIATDRKAYLKYLRDDEDNEEAYEQLKTGNKRL